MIELAGQQLLFPFGLGEPSGSEGRAEILGGKGASLAEMSRAGFPVPPGFTISTACCAWVDEHAGRWPDGLEQQVREMMQRLELATQRTFGSGSKPLLVAVRSGAAVSMPGMMDTILNCGLNPSICGSFPSAEIFWREYADHIRLFAASVAGLKLEPCDDESFEDRARRYLAEYEARSGQSFPTDPWETLRQCINAVFASWHSDRAKSYRQHHDVRGVIGTAVNVQAMFPSERSGVLFTANPNDPAAGEMILEASWGLGEAVVSGSVTPDIYAIDAKSLDLKRTVAGSRLIGEPTLSPSQIHEVAELGRRVEAHFGFPADIEWGLADGRVVLLQSRRIRGLDVFEDTERGRLAEIQRLQSLADREPVVWVVHNLSETLPAPTPLTWDLVRWFMSVAGGYGQMYRLLGHRPCEREAGGGFLELIGGRIYVDPRRAAAFHFGRLPFEYDADELLRDRTVLDRPPTQFNLDRADPFFFFRLPGMLVSMLRGSRRSKSLLSTARDRFENSALPALERFLQTTAVDLQSLSVAELLAELERRRNFVLGEFAAESLLPGFFGGMAHDQLRQLLGQLFGPVEGEALTGKLLTGLEGDITVEQNLALAEVAGGRMSRDDFLRRFGHRAVNEMELSQPRWLEEPSFVERMIDRFRTATESPRERHAEQVAVRSRAEQELPDLLARAGGSSLRERVTEAKRQAQSLLPYREVAKFHLMRGYATLRAVLVELARRWDLGRDLFFLHLEELPRFEAESRETLERIEQRKLRWRSAQKLSHPDVIDSRHLDDFGRPPPRVARDGLNELTCRAIALGRSHGPARIVFDPRETHDLGHGYVLVCPSTDPGWTPLFMQARALIVERGGALSHGAIVARDFGIPAVVLEGATQLIPNGCDVEVDANRGIVAFQSDEKSSESAVSSLQGLSRSLSGEVGT